MDRRQLFPILAAAAALPASAAPRVFTAAEYELLNQLCDLLLPTDELGPGAKQAGVPAYLDLILDHSDAPTRRTWQDGLAAINQRAQDQFRQPFLACTAAQQAQLMDQLIATPFFTLFKTTAVQGFALTKEGWESLGYRGGTVVHHFSGCTHPEHGKP